MKFWKFVFTLWVAVWLLFLVRGFAKGEFEKFRALSLASLYEKNSYILGKELNAFLGVCKKEIPPTGTYKIVGDLDEHDRYRIIYHLYPRMESEDPDYVLNIYTANSQYVLNRIRE